MKIVLTLVEITTLVCNRYQLPPDTEVEIKRPGISRKNEKVAKGIISGLGLAESKNAVEDWGHFIAHVPRTDCLR